MVSSVSMYLLQENRHDDLGHGMGGGGAHALILKESGNLILTPVLHIIQKTSELV